MRKRVFLRIMMFLLLNCVIFVSLVAMQFTRGGNFSERIGDMLINGRYDISGGTNEAERQPSDAGYSSNARRLDGGANVFFGGLEFRLAFSQYITITENEAVFTLPNGTELFFVAQNTGAKQSGSQGGSPELRIWGKFPDGVSAINIPFRAQRSSVIRNNGNDTLTISYNGSRYQFSRPLQSLDAGRLVLLASAPAISYRVIADKNEFIPANYVIAQAASAQTFADELSRWTDRSFRAWSQMDFQTDEDTVIAWCGEAVRQGVYRSAVATVPVSFSSDPQRTWESAVYQFDRRIGVWQTATRSAVSQEREKTASITRLLAEKDSNIFAERHLIEYLAIRGQNQLLNELLAFAETLDSAALTLGICPGILESYLDMDQWRPLAANPFVGLAEQVCRVVADDVHRVGDSVFVFVDGHVDTEFNMRLGIALTRWGDESGDADWAGLGRSIVFSVISLDAANGSVPASLTIGGAGELAGSGGLLSSARLYRLLDGNEYLPHPTATGVNGIWAWTAASSVNINQNDQQMDIAVTFPMGETHYVMLRNVAPFPLLQIHDMNWRRASDFESYYDSSGWYYFEEEQTLILKIRHRSNVEHIRILFTVPRVEPPPPPPEEEEEL